MCRVISCLLKARDAANFAQLQLHHARAVQVAAARSVPLPCKDSQQKLVQAPNVDSRTWAPAVLTGGAALVTDLTFYIGISQSRCAIFRQGTPLHATNTAPSCGDDALSEADSTQGVRCCNMFFCGFSELPSHLARAVRAAAARSVPSLQGLTAKANSSSERRFEDVGAGCVDGRRCASNRFDVLHWNEPVPMSRCAIFRQGTPLQATNTRVPAAGMMRRVKLILLKARDAANCFFVVLQSCHHTSRARFGQQRPAACCFLARIHSKS